jgi:hypothetical protein
MNYIFSLLFILLSFLNCSEKNDGLSTDTLGKSKDLRPHNNSLTSNETLRKTSTDSYSGISTNANILVKNGYLEILLQSGILKSSDGQSLQILQGKDLIGKIEVSHLVTNEVVNGSIEITKELNLKFVPDSSFNPNIIYQVSFTGEKAKERITENLFVAEANYCKPESYFSSIPIVSLSDGNTANLVIKDNIYKDALFGQVAVIGWDHQTSKSFNFKIKNRTQGAKYKIVAAYGSYNIQGHECELYLQRDVNSPFPTWVDSNYADKVTKVTQEDTSIRNPVTKEFYSFAKTFIIVKVFNSTNVDITGADTGVLSLEQTDSLYGLPVSLSNEEDSSLLAYLNRGNNNSYSMVLGGLTVGIFGFFLSRRLFRKEEEN